MPLASWIKWESTTELREYEVDPEDLAAEAVAAKIGLPPTQLFKALVAGGDRHGFCMVVVPADKELNLKALAAGLVIARSDWFR